MKNITELRKDLFSVYEGVRAGTVDVKVAKELSNSAGKIINSIRIQLEYAAQRDVKPNIPDLA
jgi:hypothetical protein